MSDATVERRSLNLDDISVARLPVSPLALDHLGTSAPSRTPNPAVNPEVGPIWNNDPNDPCGYYICWDDYCSDDAY